MEQFRPSLWTYYISMKIKELTPRQLSSVPCPTCGVPVGRRCLLLSGAPRSAPHLERRFCAADAVEREKLEGSLLDVLTLSGFPVAT
jgi:hypothetical protein